AIYREAYDRAKSAGDQARMADLDAAYQREQLLLEVLLDIRDALTTGAAPRGEGRDRKSTRLNSSHLVISYAVFCLKKKNIVNTSSSVHLIMHFTNLNPLGPMQNSNVMSTAPSMHHVH